MSNELNEFGLSHPKCICTNRGYESSIKQMNFESENDEDYDLFDFGNDSMPDVYFQVVHYSVSSEFY